MLKCFYYQFYKPKDEPKSHFSPRGNFKKEKKK